MTARADVAYRILTAGEWAEFEREGSFAGAASDRADGFIHLSTAAQLAGTLAAHFAGAQGLVIATIDLAELGDAVRWEASREGALFPHLHGVLPIAAVKGVRPAS